MSPRPMPPELMARFRLRDRTLNFRALHKNKPDDCGLAHFWVVEHDDWDDPESRKKPVTYRTLAEIDTAWHDETWVRQWMYWVHDYMGPESEP